MAETSPLYQLFTEVHKRLASNPEMKQQYKELKKHCNKLSERQYN